MLMTILAAASIATFDWFEYRGDDRLPRPAAGEYANPILQGFYPDPSITRVGDDYYLVNSTFTWFPGIPVFHSRDLVNWTQIGNAIDRPEQLDFKKLGLSRGVFAPDISWHDGTFYILNTCVDCGDNFVITAKDPAGPWSNPVWLPEINGGIDPSLFFDEDGSAWLINNLPPPGTPLYDGHRAIWIQRFDTKTLKLAGPRTLLLNGGVRPQEKPIWIEGPHIFRKDGWYYLIAAEGGTAENHSQVVLRSRVVTGPYEPFADNPILTQRGLPRDRPNPITSAGHADFVETRKGEWWATFLATRPYAGDFYNTGRETFLMPVHWNEGWPVITKANEVIPWTAKRPELPRSATPAFRTNGPFVIREDFNAERLPYHWMMMRNPRENWWKIERGSLQIRARPVALGDNGNPSFLARRQQHLNATATTTVHFAPSGGEEAGIVALQSDEFWYFLAIGEDKGRPVIRLRRRVGPTDPPTGAIIEQASMPQRQSNPVQLRIVAHGAAYDFSWSTDGKRWNALGRNLDGTLLSTKRAGGFVGATFGVYAYDPKDSN
jgi:alpha-N-arabinofuranosidase